VGGSLLLGGLPVGWRFAVNSPKSRWRLDSEAFARLLQAFSADPATAAELYERNHLRLARFFEWQGLAHAEELADRCLDVLARKLAEGKSFSEPASYLLGIARRIRLEALEEQSRMLVADPRPPIPISAPAERALDCLDRCLNTLKSPERDLLLRYYAADPSRRIENRKRLAASLGVQMNTLRNRALRLRLKMEECVERCLQRRNGL
jgi:DNA-directed RNA polymerase specialized sigma24 family protein